MIYCLSSMDALIVLYAGNQIDTLIWDCSSLNPVNPRHEFRLPEDPDSRAEIKKRAPPSWALQWPKVLRWRQLVRRENTTHQLSNLEISHLPISPSEIPAKRVEEPFADNKVSLDLLGTSNKPPAAPVVKKINQISINHTKLTAILNSYFPRIVSSIAQIEIPGCQFVVLLGLKTSFTWSGSVFN